MKPKKPTFLQIISGSGPFIEHAWPPIALCIAEMRAEQSPGGHQVLPSEIATALRRRGDMVLHGIASGLLASGWIR